MEGRSNRESYRQLVASNLNDLLLGAVLLSWNKAKTTVNLVKCWDIGEKY